MSDQPIIGTLDERLVTGEQPHRPSHRGRKLADAQRVIRELEARLSALTQENEKLKRQLKQCPNCLGAIGEDGRCGECADRDAYCERQESRAEAAEQDNKELQSGLEMWHQKFLAMTEMMLAETDKREAAEQALQQLRDQVAFVSSIQV